MKNKMIQIKHLTLFICIILIIPNICVGESINHCDYYEQIILTIYSCNYLENIQEFTNNSFLINITFNNAIAKSSYFINNRYSKNNFSIKIDTYQQRYITILFEVFELIEDSYFLCDLNMNPGIGPAEIVFDSYTGHWNGDDYIGDKSGYGRFNGCDDNSLYTFERDFELCFFIDVIDSDNDKIPKWYEENIYHTSPYVDDSQNDVDKDMIPLYWEYKWGYNPFIYNNHTELDPEKDGLSNYEEFLVSTWHSDPFRDDMFMELDQMSIGPNGEGSYIPKSSLIQVEQTYAKRNIRFHVDDGCMGGGEIIPFKPYLIMGQEREYYQQYFLQNDADNWRRGVFRYALFVYEHLPIRGMEFPGEHNFLFYYKPGLNSFIISTSIYKIVDRQPEECCQFLILHELGHTCKIFMGRPLGCDNQLMRLPWSLQRIIFKNYKSVMNYKYTYSILDYSNGTHGFGDYNDWDNIDLTFFQPSGAK